jgi:hypothetical protein
MAAGRQRCWILGIFDQRPALSVDERSRSGRTPGFMRSTVQIVTRAALSSPKSGTSPSPPLGRARLIGASPSS